MSTLRLAPVRSASFLRVPALAVAFVIAGAIAGCGNGGNGGTGGEGGAAPGSSSSSGSSGGTGVTYTADAEPIFAAKCAPCHTTGEAGGVDFASSYADSQKAADPSIASDCTATDTVGKCALIRIQDGSMPFGAGCTGNPTTDASNSACLTAAQQATIQAWITDGQKQ